MYVNDFKKLTPHQHISPRLLSLGCLLLINSEKGPVPGGEHGTNTPNSSPSALSTRGHLEEEEERPDVQVKVVSECRKDNDPPVPLTSFTC